MTKQRQRCSRTCNRPPVGPAPAHSRRVVPHARLSVLADGTTSAHLGRPRSHRRFGSASGLGASQGPLLKRKLLICHLTDFNLLLIEFTFRLPPDPSGQRPEVIPRRVFEAAGTPAADTGHPAVKGEPRAGQWGAGTHRDHLGEIPKGLIRSAEGVTRAWVLGGGAAVFGEITSSPGQGDLMEGVCPFPWCQYSYSGITGLEVEEKHVMSSRRPE